MECVSTHTDLKVEDDILWASFPDCILDLETAKLLLRERLKFQNGKTHPAIINLKDLDKITLEAHMYLARQGARGLDILAYIIPPGIPKTITDVLLNLNKHKIPTKTFTNQTQAEEWIWSEWSQNNVLN